MRYIHLYRIFTRENRYMEYTIRDLEIMTGYSARRLCQFMKDNILKGTLFQKRWISIKK